MQILDLIIPLQVALAPRIHAIWSVVENFRPVSSQIALKTRDYLYKIILTNLVLNKRSARALS